jgi:hypothetical protein
VPRARSRVEHACSPNARTRRSAVRARRRPKRTPKQGRAGGRPPAAAGWYFKMAKVQRWRASQEVSECGPRTIMRDRSAPLTARPSSPPGAPPPHPSPLLPLRPSPRLRHRHWRGSSWRLESPRSTSPCRRTAAAGSATRSPAPQSPSAPAPDGAPAPRGVTEEDLAGRAPCRPHSPPPPRRPPPRSPSPPPPRCGSIRHRWLNAPV